jgi:hypothetical protein
MSISFSPEAQRQWLQANLAAVQAKVTEPVVAYHVFYRSGSWGQLAAGHISPLAATVIGAVGKRRAGRLPQNFLLVLTPTKVQAFRYKSRGTAIKVGDELASWDRSAISVTVQETQLTMRLTIDSHAGGGRVVVDTGKSWATDEFFARLGTALPRAA